MTAETLQTRFPSVPATAWRQHSNGGGWVHKDAYVREAAFVGPDAIIRGGRIYGGRITGSEVHGGRIFGGEISGCTIRDGRIFSGEIFGGHIRGGRIHGGRIFGGEIYGGEIWGGDIRGGRVFDGEIYGGEIFDGYIYGGEVHGGEIFDGYIYGGTIHGGEISGGEIFGGEIFGGRIRGGRVFGGEIRGGCLVRGTFSAGVLLDGVWRCSPIQIQGSRDVINEASKMFIQIGCRCETADWWRENFARVAEENGYTPAQVEEYEGYLRTIEIARTKRAQRSRKLQTK